MMRHSLCALFVAFALVAAAHADSATNSRDDRTIEALAAVTAGINNAVSQGSTTSATRAAALRGMDTAKMTTRLATDSWEFGGRKLLAGGATNTRSDRIAQALSAASESIASSVNTGGRLDTTAAASRNGMAFAKLATQEAADSWQFGGKRKLMDSATNSNSDRITQSMNAAQAAIAEAVSGRGASVATAKNLAYSKLATKLSADPWEFGGKRKLMDSATNSNSDRITQAMNAAVADINEAAEGRDARVATTNNLAYSKLATKLSAAPWQFKSGARKLLGGETNSVADRIVQSMDAAHDAISEAASQPAGARGATEKNLAYSKLTTNRAADPWQFDQP